MGKKKKEKKGRNRFANDEERKRFYEQARASSPKITNYWSSKKYFPRGGVKNFLKLMECNRCGEKRKVERRELSTARGARCFSCGGRMEKPN